MRRSHPTARATGNRPHTRSARRPTHTTSSSCATGSLAPGGTRTPSRLGCPTTSSPRRGSDISPLITASSASRCFHPRPATSDEPVTKVVARVIVTPKPVVNDPQGLTVKQGLVTLGFREVEDVRVGKYIEVAMEAESMHEARERVEAMCRQLLANHIIEDFHFEVDQVVRR